jgi:hypothetical protein
MNLLVTASTIAKISFQDFRSPTIMLLSVQVSNPKLATTNLPTSFVRVKTTGVVPDPGKLATLFWMSRHMTRGVR